MHNSARWQAVAAAALFSTGGAAIKALSLTPWQVGCYRSALAGLVVLLLLPASRQGWSLRLLPGALAYAGALGFFALANRMTTSANAIYLQSTAPLFVAFFSPLLLQERFPRRQLPALALIAAGLGLCLWGNAQEAGTALSPNPSLGNIMALGSGVCWALSLTFLRQQSRAASSGQDNSLTLVAMGNLCNVVILFWPATLGSPGGTPWLPTGKDWLLLLYLACMQVALPYWLLSRCLRRLKATEAGILLLVEPLLNPVWTWALLGELPGLTALIGGLLILSATFFRGNPEGAERA